MPGRIIDISSNNAHPINWGAVKGAGVTTVLVKATEGTTYVNPFYAGDVANAKAQGLDVAAYHFCTFGLVASEAQHFKSVAGELARVADIETSSDVNWTNAFLADLGLSAETGCTYGSGSNLTPIHSQFNSQIWVAAYGQSYPGFGQMWQFTSSATVAGIAGPVDESRWYGTQGEYDALFGLTQPPEEEEMPYYVTNVAGTGFVVATDLSSKTAVVDGNDAATLLATGGYKPLKLSDAQINAIPDAH